MLVGRLRAGWRPSLAAHQTCVLVTIGGAAVLTQCFLYHPPPHAQKPAKKKKKMKTAFIVVLALCATLAAAHDKMTVPITRTGTEVTVNGGKRVFSRRFA